MTLLLMLTRTSIVSGELLPAVFVFSWSRSCVLNSRAGRFGTKGLAITFQSSESDQEVMATIQSRFEVAIPELPDHIDPATYSMSSILGVLGEVLIRFSSGVLGSARSSFPLVIPCYRVCHIVCNDTHPSSDWKSGSVSPLSFPRASLNGQRFESRFRGAVKQERVELEL